MAETTATVSNGITVSPAPAAPCDNCGRETARYTLAEGSRVLCKVCPLCVAANSGRSGWPYAEDEGVMAEGG